MTRPRVISKRGGIGLYGVNCNMLDTTNQPSSNVLISGSWGTLPLGIYVSIASPDTGDLAQINRFNLQTHARKILPDFGIAKCHKLIVPMKPDLDGVRQINRREVDIYVNKESGKGFYGNLITCKSIWVCPVCASKISERRRQEITTALEQSREMGHYHLLASYTVSHHLGDPLAYIADGMNEAFRRLKTGKSWQLFKQRHNWYGDIKSTEITFGNNGWHFHFHQLIILDKKPSPREFTKLESELKTRWLSALNQRAFYASWSNGLDIRPTDDSIADYVEKIGNWTVEHELTKQSVKVGKVKGRTPVQILIDYATDGVADDANLFREYGVFTKRKNQLYWSKGLRERLNIEPEMSDDELMDAQEEPAMLLATLTEEEWNTINSLHLRGQALVMAKRAYNADDLTIWHEWLNAVNTAILDVSGHIVSASQ
jgi:hypothetical protein